MELRDLFATHKQVDPVTFTQNIPTNQRPLYFNFDRAQKVVSENTEENSENETDLEQSNTLNWRVKNVSELENDEDSGNNLNWRTESAQTTTQTEPTPAKPTQEKKIINNLGKSYQNLRDLWITDMINSYRKLGLNDNAIRNLIAQTALESNYGQSVLSGYNNFGGITTGSSWTGKRINSGDKDKDGNRITQDFRVYDDMDHFTRDHLEFLTKLYDFDLNDDLNTFLSKLLGNNKGKKKYAQAANYSKAVTDRYNQIFA